MKAWSIQNGKATSERRGTEVESESSLQDPAWASADLFPQAPCCTSQDAPNTPSKRLLCVPGTTNATPQFGKLETRMGDPGSGERASRRCSFGSELVCPLDASLMAHPLATTGLR